MSRYFNTSGPNNPREHYTLMRPDLLAEGIRLVENERYFTIWAPRQTGKSTYFLLLQTQLEKKGYKVVHLNLGSFKDADKDNLIQRLILQISELSSIASELSSFADFAEAISKIKISKYVIILDEIERLNETIFGDFLHTIRELYHSRAEHCLKSVILVGISNIVGIVEDNASPFNIADNVSVPYFTDEETAELLGQHERETEQLFQENVKNKISEITANQPGLVNAMAKKLVDDLPNKSPIDYEDYLKAENWFLNIAIDKNISNIISKARRHRKFVERLLFTEAVIPFKINRPEIKELHVNGVIEPDEDGNVIFRVPLYKKSLYETFYPYTNGEGKRIRRGLFIDDFLDEQNQLNLSKLLKSYNKYVQRRSFKYFREKDKDGKYYSIKEAALMYSFETYIQAFIQEAGGKSYIEAHTGLGRTDILINLFNREYVIETKVYYSYAQYIKGKKQLAYYCKKLGVEQGVYLVFIANDVRKPPKVKNSIEVIEDVNIQTFLVEYDEIKDF